MGEGRGWGSSEGHAYLRGCWLLIAVLAIVAVSRLIAFPASIWDQDEAYFAAGVISFNPLNNCPHPPFFPLWIGGGKLLCAVVPGLSADLALRLLSLAASICLVLPLYRLWLPVVGRLGAAASVLLFSFSPVAWLLSGRAYTEIAATCLFLAAGVDLLADRLDDRRLLRGMIWATAAVLVRPQWGVVLVPMAVYGLARGSGWRARGKALILPAAAIVVTAGALALSAGGVGPLLTAVRTHYAFHFVTLGEFSWKLRDASAVVGLGGVGVALLWTALLIIGLVSGVRRAETRLASVRVASLVLLPQMVLAFMLQNATLPRYAIPLLAGSAGFVALGLVQVLRGERRGFVAASVACLMWGIALWPSLQVYRHDPSPAAQFLTWLGTHRENPAEILVADRTLVSLVTLSAVRPGWALPVVWDYSVLDGSFSSSGSSRVLAAFDDARGAWLREANARQTFECVDPWLQRIASPRFLRITVAEGASVGPGDGMTDAHADIRSDARLAP